MRTLTFNDFSIGCPQGWLDTSTIVMVGPPDGEFCPSVTVTREYLAKAVNAANYGEQQGQALDQELSSEGYKVQTQGLTSVNGVEAFERFHTFKAPDSSLPIKQRQVYFTRGKIGLTITLTDKIETFDANRELFDAAVQRFAWQVVE